MIDFQNASFVKMRAVPYKNYESMVDPLLVQDERVVATFQAMRDGVVFTDKRVIAINVQGVTGKKKDFTASPILRYRRFAWKRAAWWPVTVSLDCGSAGSER